MNIARVLIPLTAVLSAAGCRCGSGTMVNKPDFNAMPTALSFTACPTKDEMGGNVVGVFPAEEKVNIQNFGKGGGTLEAVLSGTDAAAFKLDPARTPTAIGPSEKIDLPVLFSPLKKGDSRGILTLDDGDPETEKITVDLVGTGRNLPSQPTIEAALENYAQPGDFMTYVCKKDSPLLDCQQAYPDTLLKDSTTLRIKLRNKGCPALKITSIDLVKSAGGADNMAFFMEQPSTPPSMQNPLVLTTADGTDEVTLVIRFSPESDGTSNGQRFADLTITSNDPAMPMLALSLTGNGLEPAIYAVPSFCNFNDPNDPCRPTGMKVANEAVFELTNGGTSMIKIDSAPFKSSGASAMGTTGRFTVATTVDNSMLMPGQKATLTVTHHDMPLFVIDQITVSASVPGMPAGSAGKVFLTVAGGVEPCLATEPDNSLDFNNPTMERTTKQVTVRALAMRPGTGGPCGDLIVDGTEIATNPFFSLVDPKIMPGTRIAAGMSAQINVEYLKPITGGRQATDLVIKTNDLAYGAPSFKKVLLQSESPLNQIPVCVLKGCTLPMTNCSMMGSTGSMTVSLQNTFMGGEKALTMFGGDSYDPPSNGPAHDFKFFFAPPNNNAPGASLGMNGVFTAMDNQKLTLDPVVTGQYKVFLLCKDDSGQQSGTPAQLNINVYQ